MSISNGRVATIVERHDRNSGRRPVEQVSDDCHRGSRLGGLVTAFRFEGTESNGLEYGDKPGGFCQKSRGCRSEKS